MTQFRIWITVAIILIILAPEESGAYKLKCRSTQGTSAFSIQPTPGYDHDRFGTGPKDIYREFGAYVASFDSADDDDNDGNPDLRAVPEWVAYQIKRYRHDGHGNYLRPNPSIKRPNWYEHPDLAFLADQTGVTTSKIDDSYRGVGTTWNRGHLAMSAHALRIGWRQACNTHFFFNAMPQQAILNQGDWLDLEAYTGAAANKFGSIWVISGPIFDSGTTIQTIGDPDEIPVAIPHALFKIVIKEPVGGGLPDVLAFIFEQPRDEYVRCTSGADAPDHDHTDNLVSVQEIEQRTGLSFFQDLAVTQSALQEFKARIADELWPVEDGFYGVRCGG